jgi:hypothetical protein
MTRPGLGEGDRGASPAADSQDVPRYEHGEVNHHFPIQSNDGQARVATAAQAETAHFPAKQEPTLQVPVHLPPEPLTRPREARPDKLKDGTPLGSSTKQSRATAEKENVEPEGRTPNRQPNGKAREIQTLEKERVGGKPGPTDRPPSTLT